MILIEKKIENFLQLVVFLFENGGNLNIEIDGKKGKIESINYDEEMIQIKNEKGEIKKFNIYDSLNKRIIKYEKISYEEFISSITKNYILTNVIDNKIINSIIIKNKNLEYYTTNVQIKYGTPYYEMFVSFGSIKIEIIFKSIYQNLFKSDVNYWLFDYALNKYFIDVLITYPKQMLKKFNIFC